ncbi:hypothetical protein DOTSEDRAFT_35955 [Dothistroma septosporum NZE10]|uniref:N-acetyltransferase domain-containing protein n=1 Tax=Dothistroma septosporum (strain NZE10 / CBS 128990) TaxID=675120 RepID=N1PL11_DOTSN|nr:hypothetical protein DOTSEDRAFT_35955 [Dothistroma septosporum NZE10]
MDPNFHITTPRLYISYLQASNDSHCDFLVKLWNTPEFVAACGQTRVDTREAARKVIGGRFIDEHKRNGYGTYLVSLKSHVSGTTAGAFQETVEHCKNVGTVSLMRGVPPKALSAPDLGFAILPEDGRKGYAREASQALVDYAERSLCVSDILGLFDPQNHASKGVFKSLGFQDCGVENLEEFGGIPVAIWVKRGMSTDINAYRIK